MGILITQKDQTKWIITVREVWACNDRSIILACMNELMKLEFPFSTGYRPNGYLIILSNATKEFQNYDAFKEALERILQYKQEFAEITKIHPDEFDRLIRSQKRHGEILCL
jgi:hypothetical protein